MTKLSVIFHRIIESGNLVPPGIGFFWPLGEIEERNKQIPEKVGSFRSTR